MTEEELSNLKKEAIESFDEELIKTSQKVNTFNMIITSKMKEIVGNRFKASGS